LRDLSNITTCIYFTFKGLAVQEEYLAIVISFAIHRLA